MKTERYYCLILQFLAKLMFFGVFLFCIKHYLFILRRNSYKKRAIAQREIHIELMVNRDGCINENIANGRSYIDRNIDMGALFP